MISMADLFTTAEAARHLEISTGALHNSRSMGRGPESCGKRDDQPGKPLLFARSALDEFREQKELSEQLRAVAWRREPLPVLRAAMAAVEAANPEPFLGRILDTVREDRYREAASPGSGES